MFSDGENRSNSVGLVFLSICASSAVGTISAQVTLVCVGIDQFKALLHRRGAHQFGIVPVSALSRFWEAMLHGVGYCCCDRYLGTTSLLTRSSILLKRNKGEAGF
jgi:hypothetical protein